MMKIILCLLFLAAALTFAVAHGGKKHKKDSTRMSMDSVMKIDEKNGHLSRDSVRQHEGVMQHDEGNVTADLDDFPTLHPMIVHFAIVLIILAAVLQIFNLVILKKEISWIIAGILLIGVLAAWLAGRNFHPHTLGLSEHAQLVLDQHDKWAAWTLNSGIMALLFQIVNLFVLKLNRWAAVALAIVLAVSAYSVARAGHYGSQLVHIEGIGPQGKNLEMHHSH